MNKNDFLIFISSKKKLINFNWKEIWRYRDLILLFVKRDFVSKYKQTILGPMWAIIQPLLTTVVFTVIFGNLANLTTADVKTDEPIVIPSFLFYMAGTICWTYFSTTLTTISSTFLSNSQIMGKVYFPRMVVPISSALSGLISYAIQLALFVLFWLYFLIFGNTTMEPTWYLALLPLLVVELALLSTGLGIIISSLTTKYRDLAMLVGFGIQLLQYASPIAYGLALVPEGLLPIYMLNPITSIITTFRYAFFGTGYFNLMYYLIGWVETIIIFIIGMILFNFIEKTFMDTI